MTLWWENKDRYKPRKLRAIAYMRNSADIGQENSVEIQLENIRAFAAKHDIEIIGEYADRGKSGLTAKGRPDFQKLMKRVTEDDSFSIVLCLDISRWGRFQDNDLAAHYEAICSQHGKKVVYVSHGMTEREEDKLFHQLRKSFDRYQASEYSRVLSQKTKDGAVKVARQGYRPGGSPPYGMQRRMLDENKRPDRVLNPGQRKGLQNGRTILEPGDPTAVAVVHEIFLLFVEQSYSEKQIAGHLNDRGIPSPGGKQWTDSSVGMILRNEQYAGSVVYNKTSNPLKNGWHQNPVDEWVITPESYSPLVSRALFEKAREKFLSRKRQFSRDEMLAIIHSVFAQYGFLTASLIRLNEQGLTKGQIRSQFGSIPEAFQSLYPEIVEDVKNRVFLEIAKDAKTVITYDSFLVVDESFTVRIEPAMPMPFGYGYQWFFRQDMRSVVDVTLGVPLSDEQNPEILGYFPLPRLMARQDFFCINDLSRTKMEMHGYTGLEFIREIIRLRNQI